MQAAHLSSRREYGLLVLVACSSITTGILSICLFAFAFQIAEGSHLTSIPWPIAFAFLGAMLVLSRATAMLAMTSLSNQLEAKLRLHLSREILATPLHLIEAVGAGRVRTAMTTDVTTISKSASLLVQLCVSAATVGALFCYMIWLSPVTTSFVLLPVALGASLHLLSARRAGRLTYAASRAWDMFCRNLEGLLAGLPQLKMNRERRELFVEEGIAAKQIELVKRRSNIAYARTINVSLTQALFLSTLGFLLYFSLHTDHLSRGNSAQFIFATIYLLGPLEGLLSSVMALGEVRTARTRLHEIGLVLSPRDNEEGTSDNFKIPEWKCLNFRGITYAYPGDNGFVFGPINASMSRGEIVFVTGGNGSGKSTWAKLVAGLYRPLQGQISLDDTLIDDAGKGSYREQFSIVLDDTYVFERIWSNTAIGGLADELLETWGLQSVVKVRSGCFTNTLALSRGQKKRLAMVAALLEDRPVYIFDEWAADQDAASSRHFYRTLLPKLKTSNKLVIVLTHDEGYEDVPDKVLHFQGGKLISSDLEIASNVPKCS